MEDGTTDWLKMWALESRDLLAVIVDKPRSLGSLNLRHGDGSKSYMRELRRGLSERKLA